MRPLKFFDFVHNMKIFSKLIFSYFFAAVVPVIIIGVMSYNVAFANLENQIVSNLNQAQEKYQTNIVNNLNRFQLLCDNFIYDQAFQDFIAGKYFDINPQYYYEQQLQYITTNLATKLQTSFSVVDTNLNLSIVKYKSTPLEIIKQNFDKVLQVQSEYDYLESGKQRRYYQIYNVDRIENTEWFKRIKGKVNQYTWMQLIDDYDYNQISLVREIINLDVPGAENIGLLKLTVRLEDLLGEEKVDNSDKGFSLFFNKNNDLLSPEKEKKDYYDKNHGILQQCISSIEDQHKTITDKAIILTRRIPSTEWKMLSVYPITSIKAIAFKIGLITIVTSILSLIILFLITYKISSVFSKRITDISKQMTLFQNENIGLNTRLNDVHQDEIGYLARSFNEMTDKVSSLIRDVYQANIDKKESELKALQAHINPHFLYNSLSAISRLASLGDAENVDYMVHSLSKFYRMTLNNGKSTLSISGEIEQIKAYLDIYRIRKRNFFNVYFRVDENVAEYPTLKVLLQPFVENIFMHAVFNREKPINIIISVEKNVNSIIFSIIDDGIGMKKEKTENITNVESSSSYGIKNVNERIRLQYGAEYGVRIFSSYGIGTVVTITIPAVKP